MSASFVARVLNERRRAWLARPRSHLILAGLSVLLCTSSLGVGLQLDDHAHHQVVRGGEHTRSIRAQPPHVLDLFSFFKGDPDELEHGYESGTAPWFTSPRVRLAFARPLASITHVLDYRLLERAPWAMHIHSLLWLFALGYAASRLVRRIEEGWIAGLIILFYVLDAGHGFPAGWLANRNQLIVGVLGCLALEAHVRWRRGELRTPSAALGLAALGLAAGEAMIGWAAFHLAFALTLDPKGPRRGLLAIAPLTALIVVWRIVYSLLGYGAGGSALYIDPVREPLDFTRALIERLPQLLAGSFGGPPPGIAAFYGRQIELVAIAAAFVVLAVVIAASWRTLRTDPRARFWALSAVLATIPVCATQPHARLMLISGLGVAGLVTRFIARVMEEPCGRAPRALAAFWLVMLGVISPLRLPLEAWSVTVIGRPSALAAASVPERAAGRTLVVLAVPDMMFMCGQVPLILGSLDRPAPARLRCLAGVEREATVVREDERTLVIRVPDGILSGYFAPLLRDEDDPIEEGWILELSDVTLEIAERDGEGNPLALRARFETALEDPERVFVVWSPEEQRFVPFELPAIGESARVEGQSMLSLMGGIE
jgi:hypothetical protein